MFALGSLGRGDDEKTEFLDASLPADVYLAQSRIGREYGYFAATYWLLATYEGTPSQAEAIITTAGARSEISKARAANFYVAPDTKRDQEIMQRYARLREKLPDLQRRTNFSGRFKDMMAYIGGAVVLGFIGYRSAKPQSKVLA